MKLPTLVFDPAILAVPAASETRVAAGADTVPQAADQLGEDSG